MNICKRYFWVLGLLALVVGCTGGEPSYDKTIDSDKEYLRLNLVGAILCVLCPLPLILSALANNDIISAAMLCLLILIAALGVFCFIYVGVQWASLRRLQHDPEYIESDNKKRAPSLLDTVRTVYWLIVTSAYFAWSFISGAWLISWIIWIIAGILFAAIDAIFNYFENKDK